MYETSQETLEKKSLIRNPSKVRGFLLIYQILLLNIKQINLYLMITLSLIGWLITGIVTIFLGKGAIEKLIGTQEMVGNFAYMKLENYRVPTGVGELLGVVLLAIPMTSLYGMVLIVSFMSAAVALHLSLMNGAKTYMPLIVGILAVLSYILRTI